MALTVNTNIINDVDNYSLDAKQVKGTYVAVATIAERDALPPATIIAGSLCYVTATNEYYIYTGSAWQLATFAGGDVRNVKVDNVSILDSDKVANLYTSTSHPYSDTNPLATIDDISSSGVTSITAGNGLTGGTITSTGTIAVDTTTIATKEDLEAKQDVISDIDAIRNNAVAGSVAAYTITTYGDVVTHNTNEFATSSQGAKADTAIQPNDNISQLTNDAGYQTSSEVQTALSNYHDPDKQDKLTAGNKITITNNTITTSANKVEVSNSGSSINDIKYIKIDGQEYRITSDAQGVLNVKVNGESVVTSEGIAEVTVPTKTSDITNDSGFITKTVNNLTNYSTTIAMNTAINDHHDSTKQNNLDTQTAYTSKGSSTKVPQITTNTLGQVTGITEVTIDKTTLSDLGITASAQELNYTDGVISNIQTQLNNKQATISDLETIRSNATAGAGAATTISGYGNIVTHNTNEFATAAQGTKADTALQSGSNISLLNNDSGYTTNTGTVTSVGVKMNGSTKGTVTTSGVIDLGTVLTEHQTLSDLGITATAQELNYTDGVTSSIQTQLNSKLTTNDIVDTAASTATDKALSANRGRDLQDQINNLKARGRFLSTWNCVTGLPETDPTELTSEGIYEYKSGDYYIVGTIASGSGTNYKPNGTSYTPRVASTTIETESVAVGGSYYFDGVNWVISSGTTQTVTFSAITGQPADNLNLATALNAKVTANNAITGATKTKITYDSKGLVTAGADLTAADIPSLTLSKISDVTATAAEVNYLSGVTSNVQTQLNNKLTKNADITGATKTKITYDSKGLVTSGGDLAASDIPALDASKITTGQFADARIASAATWNAKQNAITASNKLSASLVDGLATVATSGAYGDLTGTPTKTSNFINDGSDGTHPFLTDHQSLAAYRTSANQDLIDEQLQSNIDAKQDTLTTQTAYTNKGTATKVAQITTNSLGQVTNINEVDIAKTTLTDLGITATAAELNILDGATLSTTELNYVDGVTSSIQTQLNNKQATISDLADIRSGAALGATAVQPSAISDMATKTWVNGEGFVKTLSDLGVSATSTELNVLDGITSTTAELNKLHGVTTTTNQLNYLNTATSNIQTQLNNKQGTISDLSDIRSGAAKGATSIQPNDNVSELTNDAGYITSADIAGKEDTSNKVQSVTSTSTATEYPSAKAVYEYHDATKENTISDLADIRSGAALGATSLQPNEAITAATKTKITYDTNGLVTAGADLVASDIPSLDATKITSGTFNVARIPDITLSKVSDITASAAEVNILDGITATTQELNYVDGVTSNIQTQLNSKQATIDSSNKLSADLIASGFTNKVVTQDEKNTWSSKQNAITSTNKLSSDLVDDNGHTNRFVTAGEKVTWTNKQNALNEYNKLNADYIKDGDTNKVVTQTEKDTWSGKQDALAIQTAYTAQGSGTKVPQITTNTLGQVTGITEVTIDKTTLTDLGITATSTELNTLDGIDTTQSVQTQLNNKQSLLTINPTPTTAQLSSIGISGTNYSLSGSITGVKGDKEETYRTGDVNLTPENIGAQPTLPKVTNDRFLHTNASTGELEWSQVLSGVTGVKGNSETDYRTGQVNLTAANIGAEPADATILKKANVVNDVVTTTTDLPLSANQGKLLSDRIDNLESIGRFLSVWDCTTGLPTSDPQTLPYAYKTGDYYRVGVVGTTNYRPTGSSYNHVPSTVVETATINIGFIYYYDGSIWTLQAGSPEGKVQDVQVNGTTILVSGIANLTATNVPSIPLTKVSDVTATAEEVNVLDGITATTAELNILDGVTANKDELNILDGATVTTQELNYVSGATSNIQTQLNEKQNALPRWVNDRYLHVKADGSDLEWVTANGSVTGVKGNAEQAYRTGQVNISANDLGLATVATSGSYNDLTNKPTIVSDVSYDSSTRKIQKTIDGTTTDVVTLATVATSGSYNDLDNKPTIPVVNDALLTIQKNGTAVGTFTANASTPSTINITMTKSDVGLGDVVNTGDSATPVSGGTTKFTTGGAYTELAKKQDNLTINPQQTTQNLVSLGINGVNYALPTSDVTDVKVNGSTVVDSTGVANVETITYQEVNNLNALSTLDGTTWNITSGTIDEAHWPSYSEEGEEPYLIPIACNFTLKNSGTTICTGTFTTDFDKGMISPEDGVYAFMSDEEASSSLYLLMNAEKAAEYGYLGGAGLYHARDESFICGLTTLTIDFSATHITYEGDDVDAMYGVNNANVISYIETYSGWTQAGGDTSKNVILKDGDISLYPQTKTANIIDKDTYLQAKLIAGTNITIDAATNTISASGGGTPKWIEIFSITSVCDGVIASPSNPTSIEPDQTATLTYTAGTKPLPLDITVTNASYTWTRSTGTAVISNATDDVTITITGLEEWDTNPVTTEEATSLGYTWTGV